VTSTAATADPFAPARLGPVTLRNRVIKAATFEGMTPKNVPTPRLVDYHRAVAAGGVGMTTVAFCAVSRDGRGAPGELVVSDVAVQGLAELAEVVHGTGAKVSAQLGHAGPVAAATGYRGLAPSRVFSPLSMRWTRAAEEDDIERVTGDFAAAARRIVAAGFDAIELHLGHHYLLSAFLSPKLNKRTDRWGGDVERRSRFPRQVVARVHDAVGDAVALTAKLQMVDGVDGGLWLDESIEIARLLEADGTLDALQLTGGGSLLNPMYLFRGDAPVSEMAKTLPRWLRPGFKLLSPRFMPTYPFLLGGINRLDTVQRALGEGFEFVAMARALLREPDLVDRLQRGVTRDGLCIHCNKCMPTIYRGTHCVLVPPEQRPGLRKPVGR
jgi:2,4-dienoyl-CoA reductase-like NADH-dependent reductase (Old Yellow Enzyme family)